MSLPSQSTRVSRSSGVAYRRSRGNPLKRFAPAAIVVLALALILWFALRAPAPTIAEDGATTPSETDTLALSTPDDRIDTRSTESTRRDPVVIDNAAPVRTLPGSTREDEPTQSTTTRPQTPTQTPAQTPTQTEARQTNSNTGSSLLESTLDRANTGSPTARPTATPTTTRSNPDTSNNVSLALSTARDMISHNDRVSARELLSKALRNSTSRADQQALRTELASINDVLVFGPVVAKNDPIAEEYTIQSGDSLSRIAARRELATHWKLIQRINRISNPSRIRLGQSLKLIRGPFHAVVDKSDHRMDIYHGSPAAPQDWLYIRSFRVGLGLDDGTPVGHFRISSNKLENPGWVNPRNAREQYAPDDPDNPIGEYWLGLDGIGADAQLTGYGIHGTIDPDSIGGDESMGCVRLADDDIALVYELLAEQVSTVQIRP